jgi:hypothetical protein
MNFDFIVWLKAHYTPLFHLLKFAFALASAYAAARAFRGEQIKQLGPALKGLREQLSSLSQEAASYRRRISRNKRLLAHAEEVNASLKKKTARAILDKAADERALGNYESAAQQLATWFQAQCPHTAKALEILAQWRRKQAADDESMLTEAERLERIAFLIAPSTQKEQAQ